MRIAVIVFLGIAALACANAGSNVQAAQARAGGEGGPMAPAPRVLTAAPSTFEVELTDEARQRLETQLAGGSLTVARLLLRDLRPRSAQALKGVRIFLEKPDATLATPVDDPHYAGNFVPGLEADQSTLLNVAPTLASLWRSGALTARGLAERKRLRVTFVPEKWDWAAALPQDFALPFGSLTLEVPGRLP